MSGVREDVITDAEVQSDMGPEASKYRQPLEAGKGKKLVLL